MYRKKISLPAFEAGGHKPHWSWHHFPEEVQDVKYFSKPVRWAIHVFCVVVNEIC